MGASCGCVTDSHLVSSVAACVYTVYLWRLTSRPATRPGPQVTNTAAQRSPRYNTRNHHLNREMCLRLPRWHLNVFVSFLVINIRRRPLPPGTQMARLLIVAAWCRVNQTGTSHYTPGCFDYHFLTLLKLMSIKR